MIQSHNFFQLQDKTKLRVKIVENGNSNWLVILHGLGEHLERHEYLEDVFGTKYNYLFIDHRGHGMSGGKRANIEYFSKFSEDLKEVMVHFLDAYPVDDYGIYAHSMGALVACDFYKNYLGALKKPAMVFLSSPAIGFLGIGKILQYSPTSITNWIKDIPMSFELDGESDQDRYSHDAKVLHDLINDPLVNQHTETKLSFEILSKANELLETGIGFSCPVAIVIGSADKVVCPQSAFEFFTKKEPVEQVVVVPGGFHELFVETEKYRQPYIQCLSAFVERHLVSKARIKLVGEIPVIVKLSNKDAHLVET